MDYRKTKMSRYFIEKAEEVEVTPIRHTENFVEKDHAMACISLITGIWYLLGGSLSQAKRQFEMWSYLCSRKN